MISPDNRSQPPDLTPVGGCGFGLIVAVDF